MINNPFTVRNGLVVKGSIEASGSVEVSGSIISDISRAAPAWKEGLLFWDKVNHTYAVYNEASDVTLQLGQENLCRVVAAETLSNGQAVYASGSVTIDGEYYPTVYRAIADSTGTKSQAIGIVTHNISSGSIGYVTTMGVVHDIDTSGLVEGSTIYLSYQTLGGLTAAHVPEPYESVTLGYCIKQSPTNGHIYVSISNQGAISRPFVGVTMIPSITDLGSGSFSIGTGSVSLCTNSTGTGLVKNFRLNSASFYLPEDSYNYKFVVAQYNSGSPVWNLVDDIIEVDSVQSSAVYSVSRIPGDGIAYVSWDSPGILLANKLLTRIIDVNGPQRDNGLVLAQSGSGYITITGGGVWSGINKVSVSYFDSRVNPTILFHRSASAYSSSAITTVVGNYYDNGSSLQPMPANRYVVNYVYRSFTDQNRALVTLSVPYKDIAAAQTDQPWALPGELMHGNILVGRFVVYTGATSASLTESSFTNIFGYSAISDHNSLSDLQGGTSGEYYHLTQAQHDNLGVSASYASNSSTADSVEYANIANKPTLVSSSAQFANQQVSFAGVTSSFHGTASNALNAVSSSHALSASYLIGASETASYANYAESSSYASNAGTADSVNYSDVANKPTLISSSGQFATDQVTFAGVTSSLHGTASVALVAINSVSASHATSAQSAIFSTTAISSSFANSSETASVAIVAINSISASHSENSISASVASMSVSSSFASNSTTANSALIADSASFATYANSAGSAVTAASSVSASYSLTASFVANAQSANNATNSTSASYAITASYALNGGGGGSVPANTVSSSAQLSNGGGVEFTTSNSVTFGKVTASFINGAVISETTGGNVAIGSGALASSATGTNNTVLGAGSSGNNTGPGAQNTIIGARSAINNASGSNNVVVGEFSLRDNVTGNSNIAIGRGAGNGIVSGSNNVVIGGVSSLPAGLSNNVIIATGNGTQRIRINDIGQTGLGKTDPQATLDVSGTVFVTGSLSVSGSNSLNNMTVACPRTAHFGNTIVGRLTATNLASVSFNGEYNTVVGSNAAEFLSSGSSNTAIGRLALRQVAGGQSNTAVGAEAMNNAFGNDNVAVGRRALIGLSSANQNTAVGSDAGQNNSTGVANTIIGYRAGRNIQLNQNVIIGSNCAEDLRDGTFNTIIGPHQGGGQNTAHNFRLGTHNVIIGCYSGPNVITGSNNTIIGARVGSLGGLSALPSVMSNCVAIGDGAGNVRLFASSSGHVGIGKVTPTERLDVNGNALITGSLAVSGSVEVSPIGAGFILKSPNGTRWRITVDDAGVLSTTAA